MQIPTNHSPLHCMRRRVQVRHLQDQDGSGSTDLTEDPQEEESDEDDFDSWNLDQETDIGQVTVYHGKQTNSCVLQVSDPEQRRPAEPPPGPLKADSLFSQSFPAVSGTVSSLEAPPLLA